MLRLLVARSIMWGGNLAGVAVKRVILGKAHVQPGYLPLTGMRHNRSLAIFITALCGIRSADVRDHCDSDCTACAPTLMLSTTGLLAHYEGEPRHHNPVVFDTDIPDCRYRKWCSPGAAVLNLFASVFPPQKTYISSLSLPRDGVIRPTDSARSVRHCSNLSSSLSRPVRWSRNLLHRPLGTGCRRRHVVSTRPSSHPMMLS